MASTASLLRRTRAIKSASALAKADNLGVAPNSTAIKPFELPDLEALAVDAQPTALMSGETITVTYTVTNAGPGYVLADKWYDKVYISPDPDVLHGRPLKSRYSSGKPGRFPAYPIYCHRNGPSALSLRRPAVRNGGGRRGRHAPLADRGSHEGQQPRDDSRAAPGYQAPLPDLVVTELLPPMQALAGDAASLSWTVSNQGDVPTPVAKWTDKLYLSRDQILDTTDKEIGWAIHTGALAVGEDYTETASVTIPKGPVRAILPSSSSGRPRWRSRVGRVQ